MGKLKFGIFKIGCSMFFIKFNWHGEKFTTAHLCQIKASKWVVAHLTGPWCWRPSWPCTYSSHVFTNPEFSIHNWVFLGKNCLVDKSKVETFLEDSLRFDAITFTYNENSNCWRESLLEVIRLKIAVDVNKLLKTKGQNNFGIKIPIVIL